MRCIAFVCWNAAIEVLLLLRERRKLCGRSVVASAQARVDVENFEVPEGLLYLQICVAHTDETADRRV